MHFYYWQRLRTKMIYVLKTNILISDSNITVVATGVSASNDVTMPPHIQILSSDHSEQQQHHVQMQDSKFICCVLLFPKLTQ